MEKNRNTLRTNVAARVYCVKMTLKGLDIEIEAKDALDSACFRYQLIPTKGANASHSTGTIHARSSLNGSSHSIISLEGIAAPNMARAHLDIRGSLSKAAIAAKG